MPRRVKKAAASILQLRVTLLEVSPPVWRQLLVPADITLDVLHAVLNEAMGWTNSHLHQFQLGERSFGDPVSDPDGELEFEDERRFKLNQLVGPGKRLVYEYDFGDGWTHEVRVEKVLEVDPRFAYPLCIGGTGACPPEDCGGPGGYEDLLAALAKPKHPEHDELVTWVGGYFDPNGFDVNCTNRALRELK